MNDENQASFVCPHYEGDGYTYQIPDCKITLCGACHLNLAGEIFKQAAVELFAASLSVNYEENE